jgi:hypothetical protein
MAIVDVMKGTGRGLAMNGTVPVSYELLVHKEGREHKGFEQKSVIRGWVRPPFGATDELLTLEMQDGTSVAFTYTDASGAVTVVGGVNRRS